MSERTELVRAQRAIEAEEQAILGVLVMLEVGGRQAFLLRLGADGTIHRLGDGSIEKLERDRFIGSVDPDVFREVAGRVSPGLLSWCGQSRSHPAPRGEICDLVIAFKHSDGRERTTAWRYGTHSKWPPEEVLGFVEDVVRATEPWYREQKNQLQMQTRRAEYEWWQFFSVPSA